jgi:hypothetical protein
VYCKQVEQLCQVLHLIVQMYHTGNTHFHCLEGQAVSPPYRYSGLCR